MIYQKISSQEYKDEFIKKFNNFGEKAPIVLSFATDEFEVTVIHVNSNTAYKYPWDFSVPVKAFIHKIKQDLSYNHYPRVSREETTKVPLTPERQAEMIANGTPIDEVPTYETITRNVIYRIDKVLAFRDEFILIDEETGEQYHYHMNSSSFFFLKNYRDGVYKTPEEAGEVFFRKSEPVAKLKNINE